MELDFSALDNLKNNALKCPVSEENELTQRSISETSKSQPQSEFEGENGNCFEMFKYKPETEKRQSEIYKKHQENIRKAGDFIPEITKGILAADNPLTLLLKAIDCIGIMTGDNAFYSQSLQDIETVYGVGLHDPQAIEIELKEIDERLAKLWAAINTASQEEIKNLERAIKEHERRIEYLKQLTN